MLRQGLGCMRASFFGSFAKYILKKTCVPQSVGKRCSRKMCADSGGCACGPKVADAPEKTSGGGVRVSVDAALQKRFDRCARQFPMVALGGLWTQLASLLVKFPGCKSTTFFLLTKGFWADYQHFNIFRAAFLLFLQLHFAIFAFFVRRLFFVNYCCLSLVFFSFPMQFFARCAMRRNRYTGVSKLPA